MKSFQGRVAAITGASSGIGRALALDLAGRGCHLALASKSNPDALADTAREAAKHGVKVTRSTVDVADRAQMRRWARKVVKDHGRVNLIINNAGVAHVGNVESTEYGDYEWVMGINFWGVVYGTKEFLPYLIAAGEGHVVNISSVFGLFAQPSMSAYNASKFAVRGFTEALRQELDMAANGVSATCVHPGGVKTNIAAASRQSKSKTQSHAMPDAADLQKMLNTTAEAAARTIVDGVRRNERRVLVGMDAKAADSMQRLLPASYQSLVTTALRIMKR
jgi:short-subunit dehydrogenase